MMFTNNRFFGVSIAQIRISFSIAVFLPILYTGCVGKQVVWNPPVIEQPSSSSTPNLDRLVAESNKDSSVQGTGLPSNPKSQELIQPAVERPFIATPPPSSDFQNAWLISSVAGLSIDDLLVKAQEYGATQFHLGGDILQAVDDLVLNVEKRNSVQRIAQQVKSKNIETFVWSHEIHLDGRTFLFDREAPLIVARQAAYRKALQLIPELDGVVLTFSRALLPLWDAAVPEGYVQIPVPERIRFLIDMIRPVVVDELGKRLYISLDGDNPQQTESIAQVVSDYNDDSLIAILPSQNNAMNSSGLAPLLERLSGKPHLIGLDLTAGGGNPMLAGLGDIISRWKSLRSQGSVLGVITEIYGKNGSMLNSPNEITLFAFSKIGQDTPLDLRALQAEWIQKRYGLLPMTREASVLINIINRSAAIHSKIETIGNTILFAVNGDLPDSDSWTLQDIRSKSGSLTPEEDYLYRRLIDPDKQVLIDLQQESFEAVELADQSLAELESMRLQLNNLDYSDFLQRLQDQRLMAEIFLYGKQSIWGFALWKKTQDEDEALCLEDHLQKLSKLAESLEQGARFGRRPGDPIRIRKWVERIRREFPRVILGWRERSWNQIKGIVIQQTGPTNVEIRWNTAQPATSNLFITSQLPVFDQMTTASTFPVTEHKANLSNLEAGKTYFIKIQANSTDNQVTNSGLFSFELEVSPVL